MNTRRSWPLALPALTLALLAGCRPSVENSAPPAEIVRAVNRGVSLMGQYQYEGAVQSFEQAAKGMPTNTDLQINLAIALFNRGKRELGDLDRPVQLLQEVLMKEPGNVRALYFLGIIHTHVGKAELAVPCFEQVVRQQTNDGAAWYLLGLARQRIGQPADKEFLRAVELRPNLYSAWYKLGQTALAAGDQAKGNAYLDKFKQLRESPAGESIEIPQYGQMGELAMVVPLVIKVSPSSAASTYRAGPPRVISSFLVAELRQTDLAPSTPRSFAGAASGDVNSDGQLELFLVGWEDAAFYLRGRAGGLPFPAPTNWGLSTVKRPLSCAVGDFDNDGVPDLFFICQGTNRLFQGSTKGSFTEVTDRLASGPSNANSRSALWLDADHDGDLDLLVCNSGAPDQLFNNNGDGTFTNIAAAAGLALPEGGSVTVLSGDLDGDRDTDLVLLRAGAPARVFLNELQGKFHEVSTVGVEIHGDLGGVLQDLNGDAAVDLLVLGGQPAELKLFLGDGHGHFAPSKDFAECAKSAAAVGPLRALRAADVDLDGDIDVAVFGSAGHLLLNDGTGRFTFQPRIWPVSAGAELAGAELFDLTDDRVPDLLLALRGQTSLLLLLLPGELNPPAGAVALRPSGIRSRDGRTRSPASGYGVTITARAGFHESRLVYTGVNGGPNQSCVPAVLGLGGAREADYVQLLWPDGVMQVETNLAAGQVHKISELQRKISSCPVLFAWNGRRFEFVTDFAGVGGLGYFVAPGISAPPQIEEHVKIEPAQLRAKDGFYELRVNEPMEETAYIDRLELLAVDHPANVSVFPDERLAISGPPPTHELLVVEKPILPVKAFHDEATRDSLPPTGGEGRGEGAADCSDRLASVDRVYAYTPRLDRRYIGFCAPHTLELDFGDCLVGLAPSNRIFLFLHGSIEYPYSQTVFAASQSRIGWAPIRIDRQQADGSWKTIVADAGAFGGTARMMTVDLTGRVGGPHCRLRLTTNLELFYDQVFVAPLAATNSITVQSVSLSEAVLRRSGFAREVSPDGREPMLYDYPQRDATAPFHVLRGAYTRFGDVKELLEEFDDRYVLVGPGEEIGLKFDAAKFPVPAGRTRSFILVSHAYCKDMDLYTATPQTVEPLPFRAMSKYPPPAGEHYPDTPVYQTFLRRYNTRIVE